MEARDSWEENSKIVNVETSKEDEKMVWKEVFIDLDVEDFLHQDSCKGEVKKGIHNVIKEVQNVQEKDCMTAIS